MIEKNVPNILIKKGFGFTTIITSTIANIKDDSALGIYCYLASKPENWSICKKELMNHFNRGRDHINNKFAYLKSLGLIESIAIKNHKGQINKWETLLHAEIINQNTENPYYGKTRILKNHTLEKPHLQIIDLYKNI